MKKITIYYTVLFFSVLFALYACNKSQDQNILSMNNSSGVELIKENKMAEELVPNIIIDSACKKKRYLFYLNPLTHSSYETLYFHFCDPVTGEVVAIKKNTSLINPRKVLFPGGAVFYKVVAATDSLVSLVYDSPCSYGFSIPEDPGTSPSISNIICNISSCESVDLP